MQRLEWDRRHQQSSDLSRLEQRNVALIDLQDHTVGVERSNLEQLVATLDRGANRLAKISGDHQAVERRGQAGSLDLFIEEIDLRVGLLDLYLDDRCIGAFLLGE